MEKSQDKENFHENESFWEVEDILDKRIVNGKEIEYLVRWSGYEDKSFNSWVSESELSCKKMIEDYNKPANPYIKHVISSYINDENSTIYRVALINGVIQEYSSSFMKKYHPHLLQDYLLKSIISNTGIGKQNAHNLGLSKKSSIPIFIY